MSWLVGDGTVIGKAQVVFEQHSVTTAVAMRPCYFHAARFAADYPVFASLGRRLSADIFIIMSFAARDAEACAEEWRIPRTTT